MAQWIPARELQILHGDDPNHWTWEFQALIRDSVAKLVNDTALDIVGKIDPTTTSPEFGAFLVFKLTENHKNIDQVYGYVGPAGTPNKGQIVSLANASVRNDGWFEVKLGEHVSANIPKAGVGELGQLQAQVSGIDDVTPKSGLIVRAIQISPLVHN